MTAPTASDFGLPEPTAEDRAFWAPHLRDDEQLVWAGQPEASRSHFRTQMQLYWVLAGLFLIAVGVLSIVFLTRGDVAGAGTFALVSCAIVAVLRLLAEWRFLRLAKSATEARHGLSDRRVMVSVPRRYSAGRDVVGRTLSADRTIDGPGPDGEIVIYQRGYAPPVEYPFQITVFPVSMGEIRLRGVVGGSPVGDLIRAVQRANA